jgi:hypothetical protein
MTQLKMYKEWEKEWDSKAKLAKEQHPIRSLKKLPNMPGVTSETAKGLRWKALKYMIQYDEGGKILKNFMKHPLRYGKAFLKSLIKPASYHRDEDFFFYNTDSIDTFRDQLRNPEAILVLGFSYCHKPFECPSGRFTDKCIADSTNPVCQQCFIGKTMNSLPDRNIVPLLIPTIHYIGEKIFETVHDNPKKDILFIITACELTLKMFGDWGNMVGIQGIGVRLDGRICNTMKAFELSEAGVKPGLTVVLPKTQRIILDLLRLRADNSHA